MDIDIKMYCIDLRSSMLLNVCVVFFPYSYGWLVLSIIHIKEERMSSYETQYFISFNTLTQHCQHKTIYRYTKKNQSYVIVHNQVIVT